VAHRDVVGYVVASSVAFGIGGAFMKVSDGLQRLWPSIAVGALFLVGVMLLGRAVRSEGLSVAYVAGLGVEAVVSVVLGRYLFGERLSVPQGIGLLLIIGGVASLRLG
jgi:small multidrug resistance pump